ncbi:uncharacterized protein BXZ73DRAFT_106626 [Epithele typhae]|uniref:uncharacterized protein n=1 Tax=Epithele typhae TaxID=378194 RepID=UPI0020082A33|nr:uncharacterized protein BXZ73DRAFT_106626 [Epithele typhae]KAH9914385.1 hypothetical protein BXZ73DRAFT_106626 [Epithele typhae]
MNCSTIARPGFFLVFCFAILTLVFDAAAAPQGCEQDTGVGKNGLPVENCFL